MLLSRWWSRLSERSAPAPDAGLRVPPPARGEAPGTAATAATAIDAFPAGMADTDAERAKTSPELQTRFLGWLLAAPEPSPSPAAVDDAMRAMLEKLDAVIGSEAQRAGLLPRAPHVVPQLMKTLRDESYSAVDVAERIAKDVVLTAEVIRSATSAFELDEGAGIDLPRAVAVIGTVGLRRAIASVVLRPIFDAQGDSLSARAAPRIWKDADRKARLCTTLATERGLDPFDGYLLGLLHDTGWSAALRALDALPGAPVAAGWLASPPLAVELTRRRDVLFGTMVQTWQLGPSVTAVAAAVASVGLDTAARSLPLAAALRDADRLGMLRALAPEGTPGAVAVPHWAELPPAVQACYAGLRGT